jgi:hypothetical protein
LWEHFYGFRSHLALCQGEMSSGKILWLTDAIRSKLAMSFLQLMIWMRRGFSWERLCPGLGMGWEKIEAITA